MHLTLPVTGCVSAAFVGVLTNKLFVSGVLLAAANTHQRISLSHYEQVWLKENKNF
jgi:hypothetical protein